MSALCSSNMAAATSAVVAMTASMSTSPETQERLSRSHPQSMASYKQSIEHEKQHMHLPTNMGA
jgi:hypothetical protein